MKHSHSLPDRVWLALTCRRFSLINLIAGAVLAVSLQHLT